jgi:hypothetical protein
MQMYHVHVRAGVACICPGAVLACVGFLALCLHSLLLLRWACLRRCYCDVLRRAVLAWVGFLALSVDVPVALHAWCRHRVARVLWFLFRCASVHVRPDAGCADVAFPLCCSMLRVDF